ncbi:MAG: SecY-interacting protein [Pseudomonadota bacterium]
MNTAFDDLMERYQQQVQPLLTDYVEDWKSPIYQQITDSGEAHWLPCRQQPELNFDDLEAALEINFHPSLKTFYGSWYAGDLSVTFQPQQDTDSIPEAHPISLLQIQGPEDGERLLENLTGHILMKRNLKQPETLFIGLADEADDLLISIDNETGKVGLEWIGKEQHQVLADSLEAFLVCCSPNNSKTD